MEQPIAVSVLLFAIAFTLHGCGSPPPASCYRLEFDNGALPMTAKGKEVEPECDDGYEYDGPKQITCNMINRECLVTDTSNCHDIHNFGPADTGLTSFPDDKEPMLVTKFTHSWNDYIRARAHRGVGDTSKFLKQQAQHASDAADKALEKAQEAADQAKQAAEKAKDKAAQAVELAKRKGAEAAEEAQKSAQRAADQAAEAANKAKELAAHAADQAKEVAEAAKHKAADVSDHMQEKAQEAADHAKKLAEEAKERAHSAASSAKDAMAEHAAHARESASSALDSAKEHASSAVDAAKEHASSAADAAKSAADGVKAAVHEATEETSRRLSDGLTPSYSAEDMQGKCKAKADASRLYLMLPRIMRPSGGLAPQILVAMLVSGVFGMALVFRKLTTTRRSMMLAEESFDDESGSGIE